MLVDTPFVYGEAKPHHLQYVRDQLNELRTVAERVSGNRVDAEQLEEILKLSLDGTRLWDACLGTGRTKPSPWTGFDSFRKSPCTDCISLDIEMGISDRVLHVSTSGDLSERAGIKDLPAPER